MEIFNDIHFWLVLSFFVMIFTIGKKIYVAFNEFLDQKITEIKEESNESQNILNDSLHLFNQKNKDIESLKEYIIQSETKLQKDADIQYEKAVTTLNNQIKNSKDKLQNYLSNKKQEEVNLINASILQEGISKAIIKIEENLDKKSHNSLIKDSINSITNLLEKNG